MQITRRGFFGVIAAAAAIAPRLVPAQEAGADAEPLHIVTYPRSLMTMKEVERVLAGLGIGRYIAIRTVDGSDLVIRQVRKRGSLATSNIIHRQTVGVSETWVYTGGRYIRKS